MINIKTTPLKTVPINLNMSPQYSFIIPFFNEEKTIVQSIQNVINYINFSGIIAEVIVIDDASKDNSLVLVEKIESPIIIIRNRNTLGFERSLEKGIETSKGEYIVSLEVDPRITASILTQIIAASTDTDLLLASTYERLNQYVPILVDIQRKWSTISTYYILNKSFRNIHTHTKVIKKLALQKIGPIKYDKDFHKKIVIKFENEHLRVKEYSFSILGGINY